MSRWHLSTWILSGSVLWGLGCVQPIAAQVVPDNTLSVGERSQVSGNPNFQIDGGARRGGNLFHSFSEFSVPTGGSAFFNNAADIQNILTRVTGGSVSNIDGLIRANGTANLFLLNPSGIIFGKDASLNIGGSFVATTADAIGFSNIGFFSASNPEAPSPLLTINPSALLFNQIAAAPIQNNSTAPAGTTLAGEDAFGLRVRDGRSLLLVGGNISMDGGQLNAFGGQVELGGLAGGGTVGLNGDGDNLSLSFPNSVERSDVFLSNGAQVNVLASDGGSIAVNARNLEMTGDSYLLAGIDFGLGSNNSQAGNISVNATGAINLSKESAIGNLVLPEANGQGGDINISASTLRLEGGAQVIANTLGTGQSGNLVVNVTESVMLVGISADARFPSGLYSINYPGATGDNYPGATGDAGNLTINTQHLLVQDGAQVTVSTFTVDRGGSLTVNAENVQIIGQSSDGSSAQLLANAYSTGDAGNLTINTQNLLMQDGGQASASTFGAGKGGSLTVNAENVQIIGIGINDGAPSGLFTTTRSTGDAGNLTVNTDKLLVQDGARVSVRSFGAGIAGNLTINAGSIRLNNNASLTANTRGINTDPNIEQAIINLRSQDLILLRGSNITTNANGENVIGGNIIIDIDVLVAFENSDISANSTDFRGGNVKINATGIFGTQFRDALTPDSDITATGATRELNGNVQITTPDVDPTSGLVELPADFVDRSDAIATGCRDVQNSSFVVSGRGGLPPTPQQALGDDPRWRDWRTPAGVSRQPNATGHGSLPPSGKPANTKPALVEATGWVTLPDGKVILTASAPNVTSPHWWGQPVNCDGS